MTEILVLGGRGTTGRRVAARLRAAGRPVSTASRTGSDVRLDLDDPATWRLDGVRAAYLVQPDLHVVDRIPRFVTAALTAGVRRLVLLSAPRAGEEGHPLYPAERAVRESGAEWTILRPDWFAQNFTEGFWLPGVRAGVVALPTGDGRTPFVDAEDIAEVAAVALTDDGHGGRVYDLTGPRAISVGEAVEIIAAATGRPVRHVDIDPAEFLRQQVAHGADPAVARLLTEVMVAIRDGEGPPVSDGVPQVLGRPARPFEEVVAGAASETYGEDL